jgi:hypothetical protein
MTNGRRQDPVEAFASIISMVLSSIRARGWRSLMNLPAILLEAMCWRRMGEAFAELVADFRAGKLLAPAPEPAPVPAPEPAPAPAPWIAPSEREAACAQLPAPPRPAARPDPVARDRQHVAQRPSLPAAAAGPDLRRAADCACPAAALPHAGRRAAVRAWPFRRTPDPFAVLKLPAGIFATGRSP